MEAYGSKETRGTERIMEKEGDKKKERERKVEADKEGCIVYVDKRIRKERKRDKKRRKGEVRER